MISGETVENIVSRAKLGYILHIPVYRGSRALHINNDYIGQYTIFRGSRGGRAYLCLPFSTDTCTHTHGHTHTQTRAHAHTHTGAHTYMHACFKPQHLIKMCFPRGLFCYTVAIEKRLDRYDIARYE